MPALGQPGVTEKIETLAASPEGLPKVLAAGAAALEKKIAALQSGAAETKAKVDAAATDLQALRIAVAALKATLTVQRLSLTQVQEVIETYAQQESQVRAGLKDLTQAIADLKKAQTEDLVAQNTLRAQFAILQAAGHPSASSPEWQQSYFTYLQVADARDRLTAQELDHLEQRRRILDAQKILLTELHPQLKAMEEAWQAELLKRPAQQISLMDQAAKIWDNVAALPGRTLDWLHGLIASGRWRAFLWDHLTHLLGLLGFLALMGWSSRVLSREARTRFQDWSTRIDNLDLLPLLLVGEILIPHLFLLGIIVWLGLLLWIFGGWSSTSAQLILYALVTLWGLRLGRQLIQAFFVGKKAGGLSLDRSTARFYRRSLNLSLAYVLMGMLGLKSAALLSFPSSSLLFLEHSFQVGMLAWVWWLGRRPHLLKLLPALPDPAWVRQPQVMGGIRGLVLVLLVIILLADLLGFHNLSFYLAQAATWTGLAIVVSWFLWLAAKTLLHHVLHPEKGWARERYPEQQELLQRLYGLGRWVLSLLLAAAVLIWSLDSWGIKPQSLAWAFQWLTWGPTLGPVHLTPLSICAAVLALYLGFWLSRVIRSLMAVKIFPRTGLDTGVQYTIATTLHYVILILAGLITLNLLGFPLTNLALVAGALGVGIGFGLQNIVNNFLSGLILLLERPIKVGDILVIDGQWGLVKEIRVRSTIFETFDRSVLIIPNSELVSGKVLNWTHYGRGINRLSLKVGVSYDADVRQVTQLITEICRANPRVVIDPAPQIYFAAYGDSSLDFTIWVHVHTPSDRLPATHELNSAIFEAFQQHGIEIPFPQRDLHIKEWPGEVQRKGDK